MQTRLRRQWRRSLALHVLLQALGVSMAIPLIAAVAGLLVAATGESVLSNFDIARFLLSPAGVLCILAVGALAVPFAFAEITAQTWISGHALVGDPPGVVSSLAVTLRRFRDLFGLATRVLLRLGLLALPGLAILALVWFDGLSDHDINYYLAEQPPEWRRAVTVARIVLVAWLALAALQLARWSLALPILLFEHATPSEALAGSVRLTRGRMGWILPVLVGWWGLVLGGGLGIAWLAGYGFDAALDWAGVNFARVLPLIGVFTAATLAAGLLQGALLLGGQQFLAIELYRRVRDLSRLPREAEGLEPTRTARRAILTALLVLIVTALGSTALLARSAAALVPEPDVEITAHRGASRVAPENSLAAFRAAIDAGAHFAELDVQRSRDGVVVVLHDRDFMRMAGDPRRVADLDAATIATIDIGRRRGARFAGEVAPTLQQVIALVRGRMKLNIELKYNAPDPQLAPAVVEVLRREQFTDQAVITSLDPRGLRQAKALEPRLRTGLIVTASVGNVARADADFVSLNSARATPARIRSTHRAGKEVHVWTVNRADVALSLIERGADNLITDEPALLARVLRERAALSRPEQLAMRLRVLFDRPPPQMIDPATVEGP